MKIQRTFAITSVACLVSGFVTARAGAQGLGTSTWHDVYEPNTSNNNFKFNNTSPFVNTSLWTNGNQHDDLNVSKVSVHSLAGSFGGKIYAHLVTWFNGSHLSPGYNSNDPAVVDAQIDAMLSRGINGVIVDWYGPNRAEDTATLVWRDRILARGLGNQFVLGIMIDKGALSGCTNDCTTRLNSDIHDYVIPTYENTMGSAYMHDPAGKPILYFFNVQQNYPSIDWGSVRFWASSASGVADHTFLYQGTAGLDPNQVPTNEANGAFAWLDVSTTSSAYLTWYYQQNTHGRISVGSAYKGFDDSPVHCWNQQPCPRLVTQRCGLTWLDSFAALRGAATPVQDLQLVTWNDYEEGTALEIGIDNCLDAVNLQGSGGTVSWSPQFAQGGDLSTIHHYKVWVRLPQTQTMYDCSGDLPTSQTTFDLGSCPLAAGTYDVYVQAVGQPLIKNKLSAVPTSVLYTR
jgi:hypothetical protein